MGDNGLPARQQGYPKKVDGFYGKSLQKNVFFVWASHLLMVPAFGFSPRRSLGTRHGTWEMGRSQVSFGTRNMGVEP